MKKKFIYFIFISFLIFTSTKFAQSFNWAEHAGGAYDDYGKGISIDANGNTYVTGNFNGTTMFGTIQLVSNGNIDIFIAKYDESGNCLWAKQAGGNFYDYGNGISTDANGNSYVTGTFEGTAMFGTIQLVSNGYIDIFIAKYDASGNCLWAKQAGGIYSDYGWGISTDASGNIYVTGEFGGTVTFGTIQLVSNGEYDIFIAKYDESGNCIWAKQAGGNFDNYSNGISTDSNGNAYVTGCFGGNAIFGSIQIISSGLRDIFIAKYDVSGNCIWAKQAGGIYDDYGQGISTDENENTYVTGIFKGTATFGTIQLDSYGYKDIFIAKYDASGNCVWAKQAGGINDDYSKGISTDVNGNTYVTGHFGGTVAFGTKQLVSYGGGDIFIAKYDESGNCIWAKQAGGNSSVRGFAISTGANGNTYVTGSFADTASFGTTQLVSYGGQDIFVAAIDDISSTDEGLSLIPSKTQLYQNYPNPFNPSTTIKYQIPELSFVVIKVYDLLGKEITTLVYEEKPAGAYEVEFDAFSFTSGIYFYRINFGDFAATKKMILLK